ncbi:PREDICTED: putative FBD-associated F-box protein At5g53635 [Camelina sativa]|uniref:FBD-associated F-box protein At5g53635 n=1 Tax=Camelina sativa TaxID=90675 RepID=A0ABM1QI27_CAMSA|nr:PREDICTED: putative FBD-associated F-box protein At5g53635 [Camelina sativa]
MNPVELLLFSFQSVLECLLSSLEAIDIKTTISGHLAELNLELVKDKSKSRELKRNPNVMFSTTVPQCLVTSLKFVELKHLIPGYEGKIKMIRYLLKNSTILEKLRLNVYYTKKGLKKDRISQLPESLIYQILSHLPSKQAAKTSVLPTRWKSLWLWLPCLGINMLTMKRTTTMVDRGKSKQACSSGYLSRRLEEDRISQLPDLLICQILSHLPTKESVKTSVLSTRWASLWLWVPCLELTPQDFSDNFNAFRSFGNRFFHSDRASFINKFKLFVVDHNDPSYLTPWFDAAIKRKIQHLHVSCPADSLYELPTRSYTCETLVSLKLDHVTLDGVEFVSLPCLKTMHLKYILYGKESIFQGLVSRCPVLEKLKIAGSPFGDVIIFRLHSTSLKKLCIQIQRNNNKGYGVGFVVDAPGLGFLSISDKPEGYKWNDRYSDVKVDICLPFDLEDIKEASISLRSSIHNFLPGISKVRDMTICKDIFKLICQYGETQPLPQFGYMSRLYVNLCVSDLKNLPTFLGSCPNLKSLILVWINNSKNIRLEELSGFDCSVPECLLSSLEYVDIKSCISGYGAERKLIRTGWSLFSGSQL